MAKKYIDESGLKRALQKIKPYMGEGGGSGGDCSECTDANIEYLGSADILLLPVTDNVWAFGIDYHLDFREYIDIVLHNPIEDVFFLLSETSGFLDTFFDSRLEASMSFTFSPAKIWSPDGFILATLIVHEESSKTQEMMYFIANCDVYLVYRTKFTEV